MTTHSEALNIALDYMNERLEDHDCKYQRHPATEAERINILADIETVKEALAQPEQEPVAVLFQDGSIVKNEDLEFVPEKSGQRVQMLYTTPPQRTWVGLTDDERGQIYEDWRWGSQADNLVLCKGIEAKLKEKNT